MLICPIEWLTEAQPFLWEKNVAVYALNLGVHKCCLWQLPLGRDIPINDYAPLKIKDGKTGNGKGQATRSR